MKGPVLDSNALFPISRGGGKQGIDGMNRLSLKQRISENRKAPTTNELEGGAFSGSSPFLLLNRAIPST